MLENGPNPVIMHFDVSEDACCAPNDTQSFEKVYVAVDARNSTKKRESFASGQSRGESEEALHPADQNPEAHLQANAGVEADQTLFLS
jgi:hypothetical protein